MNLCGENVDELIQWHWVTSAGILHYATQCEAAVVVISFILRVYLSVLYQIHICIHYPTMPSLCFLLFPLCITLCWHCHKLLGFIMFYTQIWISWMSKQKKHLESFLVASITFNGRDASDPLAIQTLAPSSAAWVRQHTVQYLFLNNPVVGIAYS